MVHVDRAALVERDVVRGDGAVVRHEGEVVGAGLPVCGLRGGMVSESAYRVYAEGHQPTQ